MNKHLLAENHLNSHKEGNPFSIAVIRTVKPIAIFEVLDEHIQSKKWQRHYEYKGKKYTFTVHHYTVDGILSVEEASIPQMFKHMDDAWYWFKAYLDWVDEQFNTLDLGI